MKKWHLEFQGIEINTLSLDVNFRLPITIVCVVKVHTLAFFFFQIYLTGNLHMSTPDYT